MTIQEYVDILNTRYKTGISREHSYRGDLQTLLSTIATDVLITNEPARIACGAPDYIITKGKNNIPVGYIEAKDIGKPLNSKDYKEQFDRYRSLPNLIITDYLEFQLFIDGEFKTSISIAKIQGNSIVAIPENFESFTLLIKNFCTYVGQTIKSASKLAKMMANNARLMATIIENALNSDEETQANSTLKDQMLAFKQILIHDINNKTFADIYAQTIAYGMFAARYHDPSLPNFSREEAATLIPKSNPFLRKLFQYIAGYDLDTRIAWIIDALVEIFLSTDVADILQHFGKSTQQNDPVIHFYETFLSEYDPALRKSRGVWYTPEPVVNFIVRAVDDILKTEFDLPQGLADTSKTKIKVLTQSQDKRTTQGYKEVEHEVHRVQILDPAAGTGTFLAEVVKQIYKKYEGQQGIWSSYVEQNLIPRLNGFEILMASYAMAHLKLDMLFSETGYKPTKDQRFRVYLTNSLEESHPDTGTIFTTWLSTEANEANHIKSNTPVMVVLGNPPYSVSSNNKSQWIENLTADYKKDLNERNIQPLSDDYIKFIRFGQHFIEKNGSGVLAYISNNSFIDGLIHRQMRKNLLQTFDKIYILDLHGSAKRNETAPDGTADQNVFDIMQGVSINIFVKTGQKKKNELGKILYHELFGKREVKYDYLRENTIKTVQFVELKNAEPNFYFVSKNNAGQEVYEKGIKVNELFSINTSGVKTHDDGNLISIQKFQENNHKYYYRPFDIQNIEYDLKKVVRHRFSVMKHLLKENIAILFPRQAITEKFGFFVSKGLTDINYTGTAGQFGAGLVFPLYLYHGTIGQQTINQTTEKTPNLNAIIINEIVNKLGLTFTNEKETTENTFAPIDILDYIYAVLHSPTYREKYKEFLKIDFPRVPYPKDTETFWQLVKLGGELRQIHLLESPIVEQRITTYPQGGNNEVIKISFENGKVWINSEQYFDGVPKVAWDFYIGGYQPAQKWLKDRKGHELSFEDILHYQKIIVALTETDRLTKEIDKTEIL